MQRSFRNAHSNILRFPHREQVAKHTLPTQLTPLLGREREVAEAVIQKSPAWGVKLWGCAEALREVVGISFSPMEYFPYKRSLAAAQACLGQQTFATVWTTVASGLTFPTAMIFGPDRALYVSNNGFGIPTPGAGQILRITPGAAVCN